MEKSFVYGVAVTDYNFTGRVEETRRLKQNFENGINSILISPRRWGKTSLVDHVCRQLEGSNIITVRLDIFGCKSEYDFYNVMAAAAGSRGQVIDFSIQMCSGSPLYFLP